MTAIFGAMAFVAACAMPAHAESSIARQAREWKVRQCLQSIDALADFLTKDTKFSVRSDSSPAVPDKEIYSVSLIAKPLKGEGASGLAYFAHAVVAPLADGGCNASYDIVMHYPQSCEAVRRMTLTGFPTRLEFGSNAAAYASEDGKVTAYMLPAKGPGSAEGCTVIKQQTLYRAELPN